MQPAPFANEEAGPRKRSRMTLIFSGNILLALSSGKNTQCSQDNVLSLSANQILHLFNKYL